MSFSCGQLTLPTQQQFKKQKKNGKKFEKKIKEKFNKEKGEKFKKGQKKVSLSQVI